MTDVFFYNTRREAWEKAREYITGEPEYRGGSIYCGSRRIAILNGGFTVLYSIIKERRYDTRVEVPSEGRKSNVLPVPWEVTLAHIIVDPR